MAAPHLATDPAPATSKDVESFNAHVTSLDQPAAEKSVDLLPPNALLNAPKKRWKMASLIAGVKRLALGTKEASPIDKLFRRVDPAVDGEDCLHDCDSCAVHYPKGFKIEESDELYGIVKGWETHILVATGKTDWVRDVADEKGSIMQAVEKAEAPSNGKLMLSASNIPTPHHSTDYSEPTTVLLLPAFTIIDNVTPESVPTLISEHINKGPTNTMPITQAALLPTSPLEPITSSKPNGAGGAQTTEAPSTTIPPSPSTLTTRPCPHRVLILLCSHKTRDARCGQSAPLMRKELERHLRPLGLYRDLGDERPGGVGIYFINHVGGHKYSANVMIYRRPDAFGVDNVERAKGDVDIEAIVKAKARAKEVEGAGLGAAQGIWLARLKPEDCENLVKYTVLQGKLVKPDSQLRGGFDRARGVMSW